MLIFGWVSEQIQSNWAAWSNWKETGTQEDADRFYEKTKDGAVKQGLSWFCYEIDM